MEMGVGRVRMLSTWWVEIIWSHTIVTNSTDFRVCVANDLGSVL